jgi:hypothetical protein
MAAAPRRSVFKTRLKVLPVLTREQLFCHF